MIKYFSQLLKRLEHDIDPFKMSDLSESHTVTGKYLQCLSMIKCKVVNYSVSEATKVILDLKKEDSFESNDSISETVDQFLKPLHLTAVFFNHKFQMDYFVASEQQTVLDFLDDALNRSAEDTKSISDYILKTSDFKRLFKKSDLLNSKQFWVRASLNYQKVSLFALEVLAIPACLPNLPRCEILKVLDKYSNDEKMKNLMLALLLEDSH